MNKRISTFLTCLLCFGAVPVYAANDVVVIDKMSNNSIVSGTITRISGESIFVENAGREIEVELDDLDIDNIGNVFAPGMSVTAKGDFTDDGNTPVMEAEEIVRADNTTSAAQDAQMMLLNDDIND